MHDIEEKQYPYIAQSRHDPNLVVAFIDRAVGYCLRSDRRAVNEVGTRHNDWLENNFTELDVRYESERELRELQKRAKHVGVDDFYVS